MHAPDAACRIGGRPTRLLEVIRGPQADLLLFSGLSPTPEVASALQAIEESVASLREHLRVLYVFPSQAYASDAGMNEYDPKLIVDGLEKLHATLGIREPEIVYCDLTATSVCALKSCTRKPCWNISGSSMPTIDGDELV
jgi:hypothetical protein